MTPQSDLPGFATDEWLMDSYYQGQDDALGELHGRHCERLQIHAYRRLPPHLASRRELAEDLVSGTFSLVVSTRLHGRGRWSASKGLVRVWLAGIVRNQVISFLRVRKGKEIVAVDRLQIDEEGRETRFEETLTDHRLSAEQQYVHTEDLIRLDAVLAELPEEHQRMVVMKYQEDCSHAEIGEAYGVSVPTVSRRLHESRRRLQRCLERPARIRT